MLVLGLAVSVRVSGFRARFRVKVRAGFETPGYETPGYEKVRVRYVWKPEDSSPK